VKISIVTISYNQAGYIAETIESVIGQTYHDIEYIIMDGGSTDGTQAIVDRYRDDIDVYISESDDGPGDALNKGFRAATGDFVMYLNSDDLLLPNAVESIVQVIKRRPDYDVYYGHGVMQFDHDDSQVSVYSDRWDINMYRHGLVSIFQQSTAIRKTSWDRTDGFNLSNYDNWDGELLVDLYLSGATFYRYDFATGIFRMYNESISGSLDNVKRYANTKSRISTKILEKEKLKDANPSLMKVKRILLDPVYSIRKAIASGQVKKKMKEMRTNG